jgi:hypothetical protein
MKFKFIFILLLVVSAISGLFYGLSNWSLHKGASAAKLEEFASTGSWPVRYVGIYTNLLTGEKQEFSVYDPIARAQLENLVGQEVVLLTEDHFLSLWNSHAHSVRGVQELELALSTHKVSDGLCRLIDIVRRSAPMVDVLKSRVEKYDPGLLELIRQCDNE